MVVENPEPQTNIVFFDIARSGVTYDLLPRAILARGVRMGAPGSGRLRAVTRLDIAEADVDTALGVVRDVLAAS